MFAAPNAADVEAQRAQPTASAPYATTTTTTVDMKTQSGGPTMSAMPQTMPQQGMATTVGQSGQKSSIIRVAESIEWGTQMFLIAFFSLLVMIVSSQVCTATDDNCSATRGYQVAVGAISFVVALIASIVHMFGKLENIAAQTAISSLMFLWWLAGVIVLTFFGDFTTTKNANGYFGSWGAFILSTFSLVAVSPRFEHGLDRTLHSVRKPLFFLIIASAITMGASIGPCSPSQNCTKYSAWALVASVVSLVVALFLFFLPGRLELNMMKYVAAFFVLWWIFATGCMTLGGPFTTAGNGYFGSFAALLASVALLRALHRESPPV
jgi:hypothetical protein